MFLTHLTRVCIPVATNGIVIATEKKTSSILIDDSMIERVAVICPNIGIVYSGMGPDFRILVTKARKSAQAYWKLYGEYPPTKVLTQEIANIMQQATQSGYVQSRHIYDVVRGRSDCSYPDYTAESGHMAYHCSSLDGISTEDQRCIRSILPDHSGHGRLVRLVKTW